MAKAKGIHLVNSMSIVRLPSGRWHQIAATAWSMGPTHVDWAATLPASAGMTLLRGAKRTFLVDTGGGPQCHPAALKWPVEATDLILTHGHPDHVSWLGAYPTLPVWGSRKNPATWDHRTYVQEHWSAYASCCEWLGGCSRADTIAALPSLERMRDAPEQAWRQALAEALLSFCEHSCPVDSAGYHRIQEIGTGPLESCQIGQEVWEGWWHDELFVIPSGGHAPDHLIAWWQPEDLWIVGDETAAVPVWLDSDHRRTMEIQRRLSRSCGATTLFVAGHQAAYLQGKRTIQSMLLRLLVLGEQVEEAVLRNGDGVDSLYRRLREETWFQPLIRQEFPHAIFFALQFLANWHLQLTQTERRQPGKVLPYQTRRSCRP